jgi:hypothetical protein
MAGLYVHLGEVGFTPDYLDRCTLLDIDLFTKATNRIYKERAKR